MVMAIFAITALLASWPAALPRAAGAAPDKGKAAKGKSQAAAETPPPKPMPLPEPDRSVPLAQAYCAAIRDQAAEARFAWQAAHVAELAKQLDDRLSRLEQRSADLKQWMAKREAFAAQVTAHLIGIFGAMRPEAASEQLVRLEAPTAAAILGRLDQRAASAILNDMPPEKAARLTAIMFEMGRKGEKDGPK
jgi:flagellar motility protein MotE (MotC chaperone)